MESQLQCQLSSQELASKCHPQNGFPAGILVRMLVGPLVRTTAGIAIGLAVGVLAGIAEEPSVGSEA